MSQKSIFFKSKSSTSTANENDLNESFFEVFRSCQNSVSAPQVQLRIENDELKSNRSSEPQKNSSISHSVDNPIRRNDNFCDLIADDSSSFLWKRKSIEISSVLKNNMVQHCPICFKKNSFDQAAGFITHLKACAVRNKVSTEQLIKAVQLVEKQTSERLALGLPKIPSDKTIAKKNPSRKMRCMDSNMQLALALSVSLRESEMLSMLKETETLLEAGLEQEAMTSCKKLEDFGFKTSKPADVRLLKNSTRSRDRNNILFTRSQAERERIITEKVAIILVECDEQNSNSYSPSSLFEPKSKFLRNIRDQNCIIWKKSYQLHAEVSDEYYYLENLSNFISPCKVAVGASLKHISQIPGRLSSPGFEDESHFSRCLQELTDFFRPNSSVNPLKSSNKHASPSRPAVSCNPRISRLSQDYKFLIDNNYMSDLIIYVKNERSIYAHKLVFYARCNAILSDTIRETENGKTTEIIMWMEFCYESVIAFLEYVYADASDSLKKLDASQLSDMMKLCTRYRVDDLKKDIDQLALGDGTTVAEEKFDSHLCVSGADYTSSISASCHVTDVDETVVNDSSSVNDGEKNLSFLLMALASQNEAASPEMFEESNIPNMVENVDDDFSLSIRDSSSNEHDKDFCTPGDTYLIIDSQDSVTEKESEVDGSRVDIERNPVPKIKTCPFPKEPDGPIVQWTCDTDVICLSDDEDFGSIPVTANPIQLNGMKSEKRKSPSPLASSPAKKTNLMNELHDKKSRVKCFRRRMKKTILSQSYTLSDSLESSDSDESVYKINATNDSICERSSKASFLANSSEKSSKHVSKSDEFTKNDKLMSSNSDFELDDFRNLEPECRNISNSSCSADDGRHNLSTSKQEPLPKNVKSHSEIDAPYISPIWDGFDAVNDDYFPMNFSPSPRKMTPISKVSTPVRNLLTESLVSPLSLRSHRNSAFNLDEFPSHKSLSEFRTSDIPSFETFSIDDSVLNKLENVVSESIPGAQSQIVTPSNIRTFKARSKSDTFLTPSPRSNGSGTPMANYSGMKTCDLKKELDKYGIKPGLGKKKAKQLLKHIYDQLHPIENEITPKCVTVKTERLKMKKQGHIRNLVASSSDADEKVSNNSTGSDDSCDSFASGIDVLEASFVEDELRGQDNVEETKSQKIPLDMGFKNLLREDEDLHTQILLYEPIWLEELKIKLKEKNIKCSSLSLMNYLDEKNQTTASCSKKKKRKLIGIQLKFNRGIKVFRFETILYELLLHCHCLFFKVIFSV